MTQEKTPAVKKSFSVDWLLRGALTRVGDIFDRLTGRSWKPSSSIATSELIERIKKLLDSEVKDSDKKVKFVPHNIKLKMQWDKFSTDSEDAMKKLEYELLTAVIDHINDNRYHTYAPLKLEIKPDYFTEGVKLLASFDKFAEENSDAELNVTVPNLKNIVIPTAVEPPKLEEEAEVFVAEFTINDKPKKVELTFKNGQRLSVGRTRENALSIDDTSVSKIHASLVLSSEKQLMVADTGSTNGTFINDKRIAYGKAFPVADGDKVKFGTVEVSITYVPKEVEQPVEAEQISTIETQPMISAESYSEREDLTVAADSSLVEKAVEEEQISSTEPAIETQTSATVISEAEVPKDEEDAPPPTEQRIVLDFGENK
jgi:pSer/pThr/pTyr-binding forkhead associated (FHA) protein